jgi:ABC-2 type transport system ATP-binding protein
MGRIGGLAVALGVGAAVVSGWSSGLASADDSPGSVGSPPSNSAAGEAEVKPGASGGGVDSSDAAAAAGTATTGTDITDPKDEEVRSAPPGVVVGTGGLTKETSAPGGDEGSPRPPAKSKGSDRDTVKHTKASTSPRPAVADAEHDSKLSAPAAAGQTTNAVNRLTDIVADPPERTTEAASLRTFSAQSLAVAAPTPAPTPPPVVAW